MVGGAGFGVDFLLVGEGSLFRIWLRSRAAGVELAVAMGLMVSSNRSFLSGDLESVDGSVDLLVLDSEGGAGCSNLELEALGRANGSVVGMPT